MKALVLSLDLWNLHLYKMVYIQSFWLHLICLLNGCLAAYVNNNLL